MKIIFVGPDCAGKSTIAKTVSKELNYPLISNGRVKNRVLMTFKVLNELLSPNNAVYDRWQYPDDIIYEDVCSNKSSPLCMLEKDIEKIFNDEGNIMVYVTAINAALKARYDIRGDELRSLDEIFRAAERYDEFFSQTKINFIKVDTTDIPIERVCELVTQQIKLYHREYTLKKLREQEAKASKLNVMKEGNK